MLTLRDLDDRTREFMLKEFEDEQARGPYRSKLLSHTGHELFPGLMREAIRNGDEKTLERALSRPGMFNPTARRDAAQMLALSEFLIWYTRGLAARLIDEGVAECVVYRAGDALEERAACTALEGQTVSVQDIYDGHRAGYHNKHPRPGAISIPSGPNCHHTITRTG